MMQESDLVDMAAASKGGGRGRCWVAVWWCGDRRFGWIEGGKLQGIQIARKRPPLPPPTFDDRQPARTEYPPSVLLELNINPMKQMVPTPAIVKYANFIRGTAVGIVDHRKGSEHVEICLEKKLITAYTLSAISPHMRFNASLGKYFGSVCTHANELHPFRKWIDAYTNGNFELVADQMEDMLHRITEQLTDKDLEIISCLYHQALRYELEILADQIAS